MRTRLWSVLVGVTAAVVSAPASAQVPAGCAPNALNVPGAPYPCLYSDGRATFRVARVGPRGWWFVTADTGQQTGVTLDLDGIPLLADAEHWPLELDSAD